MKPNKILIGIAVLVCLCIVCGVWVSTQWVASMLNYHAQLGAPMFFVGQTPVYAPKFFYWWYFYGVYAPQQFDRAASAVYAGVFFGIAVAVFASLRRARGSNALSSHGTARWADEDDIKRTGLLENKGVVLGKTEGGRYLRHDGPEHLMVMAPTRSGKGVGIIIPTLLTWPHSVLVTDIKGENWGVTAGFRHDRLNNKTLKFDPTANDGSSVRYNPLEEIRLKTENEVRDCQNIADMLVDPQGTGQLDHWAKTGHALLVGVALHLKYTLPNASLPHVASFLSNPEQSFEDTLLQMMQTEHDTDGIFGKIYGTDLKTHPVVAGAARELLNKSDNERSGVLSTAMSFLGLYRDPVVAHNTSVSEFTINDLMNHESPVSLYLVVPPSDINRTRPLIRMILNQVVRRLTEKMEFIDGQAVQRYNHRLLLLLDEFPALGRLDAFESALAYIAGYGLKSLLIIQSLNQLNKTYTQQNSIVDNCHIRVAFTPNDANTPEFISKLLGMQTIRVENKAYSGHRLNLWLGKINTSMQETGRQLLTPGEVAQLPKEDEIIFVAGFPAIRAKKIFYYEDGNFTSRLINAPAKSDVVREAAIGALSCFAFSSAAKSVPAAKIEARTGDAPEDFKDGDQEAETTVVVQEDSDEEHDHHDTDEYGPETEVI